mmetsp:Transcript_45394/g.51536  ORF Transcript_45394/g.51536 Transcript_45394/m.51536 type:complete len:96 (+) Transcript_45394:492-779(+)
MIRSVLWNINYQGDHQYRLTYCQRRNKSVSLPNASISIGHNANILRDAPTLSKSSPVSTRHQEVWNTRRKKEPDPNVDPLLQLSKDWNYTERITE